MEKQELLKYIDERINEIEEIIINKYNLILDNYPHEIRPLNEDFEIACSVRCEKSILVQNMDYEDIASHNFDVGSLYILKEIREILKPS